MKSAVGSYKGIDQGWNGCEHSSDLGSRGGADRNCKFVSRIAKADRTEISVRKKRAGGKNFIKIGEESGCHWMVSKKGRGYPFAFSCMIRTLHATFE